METDSLRFEQVGTLGRLGPGFIHNRLPKTSKTAKTGVDPVSWTPEHLRSRSPRCRDRDDLTYLSFVGRWLNWCMRAARRRVGA